ncbi:hypothetical protein ANCCAN_01491 [Ancylostoma caninum]|uniref:Uncharacterized protein n=1 Tax=Ancylostoma caninum TaxID=29170 RepID=A0A368H9Q8_ANCCA|nr:hypothetical protein ANCCAN_01491 [Ancylostoma caninum]
MPNLRTQRVPLRRDDVRSRRPPGISPLRPHSSLFYCTMARSAQQARQPRKSKEERALKKAIKKQAREARREAELANGLEEKAKLDDAIKDQEMKEVPESTNEPTAPDEKQPVPAPDDRENSKPDVSSESVKVEE